MKWPRLRRKPTTQYLHIEIHVSGPREASIVRYIGALTVRNGRIEGGVNKAGLHTWLADQPDREWQETKTLTMARHRG